MTVYHYGTHTCPVREDKTKDDDAILKAIEENPAEGPRRMAMSMMNRALAKGDVHELPKIAKRFANVRRVKQLKQQVVNEKDVSLTRGDWISVVEFKEQLDKEDPYLIPEVNPKNFNNRAPFVLKMSKFACEQMVNMDVAGKKKNCMQRETVFFDAMHSRTQGMKTLTLWTYHPPSRRIIVLATMEVLKESTDTLLQFWMAINNSLQIYTGDKEDRKSVV